MNEIDAVLGWPLDKAQTHLAALGILTEIKITAAPHRPVGETPGEYRVISYHVNEVKPPLLIVSFFPFGVSKDVKQ